jgi:hypothetical protein
LPEQSKGQNYCTEFDACILKNSNFAGFFGFASSRSAPKLVQIERRTAFLRDRYQQENFKLGKNVQDETATFGTSRIKN